jgi:hypothetical protein
VLAVRSKAYELLLRFPDGHEELQLTDHLEHLRRSREVLVIRDRFWRITAVTQPSRPTIAGRLVCVSLDVAPRDADASRPGEDSKPVAA